MHEGAFKIDSLRHADDLGKRHIDDPSVLPGYHAVEFAGANEIHGVDAESLGDQAVNRIGLTAPLHMTEHGDPGLGSGHPRDRGSPLLYRVQFENRRFPRPRIFYREGRKGFAKAAKASDVRCNKAAEVAE
jgi:hypothetical protein